MCIYIATKFYKERTRERDTPTSNLHISSACTTMGAEAPLYNELHLFGDPPEVLLLRPLHPILEEGLSKSFRFLKPWESNEPFHDFLDARKDSIRVILCSGGSPRAPIDATVIGSLPNLECIVARSTGVNHIDLNECRRRGISVANVGSLFAEDTADYAVGLLIDVLRRISAADRYVRKGMWVGKGDFQFPPGPKVSRKRVGIIGLGNIGGAIAKRLSAFGCPILYHTRRPRLATPYTYCSSVLELASKSEILIAACPLTRETRHMINRDVLATLGKNGVLINIGRGPLVDERELVRCLKDGEIWGAGIDVFENEPKISEELLQMDNVVLSPHRAAFTTESVAALIELITANLQAFFAGRPLLTPVLEKGVEPVKEHDVFY